MTITIDVVILSWNRKESTLVTIDNIHQQQGVIPKIWVIDQGSELSCLQALRKAADAKRIELLEMGRNTGVAGGRNIGMAQGTAEYILSIDNDAIMEKPDALAYIVKRFEQDRQLAVFGMRVKNFYTGLDDIWAYPRALRAKCDQEFYATRYAGGGHVIRRSALLTTKGYDETLFFYWEELDLSYQLIARGYKILYSPAASILHKVSPEAHVNWQDNRYYYMVRNALYLHYKYFQSFRQIAVTSVGYLIKGIYNRVFGQALAGVRDALRKIRRLKKREVVVLNAKAKEYVWQHDLSHRGSIWQRIWREVFDNLQ